MVGAPGETESEKPAEAKRQEPRRPQRPEVIDSRSPLERAIADYCAGRN